METFFLNLRRIRKIRGLSQEELADKLNVTRQTISGWETDRCQPDIEMLKMLADVLKVDVSELLYGTKPSGYPRYQKKYLIWFGVTGGIVVAFFIFRMFLFPMADAYTAQHFMVNYRYFLYFGLLQIGFFAAELFVPAAVCLFVPLQPKGYWRWIYFVAGIAVVLPSLLIFLGPMLNWQPPIINWLTGVAQYSAGRVAFLILLPVLSGILFFE